MARLLPHLRLPNIIRLALILQDAILAPAYRPEVQLEGLIDRQHGVGGCDNPQKRPEGHNRPCQLQRP